MFQAMRKNGKRGKKKSKVRNGTSNDNSAIFTLTLLWRLLLSIHHTVHATESGMMLVMASVGIKKKI